MKNIWLVISKLFNGSKKATYDYYYDKEIY